ncbi:MAG TPA: nuclear transport factor 2 family protein [Burkholderiaceae bacterium]|jgi:ketosteroid isomerase-like protein
MNKLKLCLLLFCFVNVAYGQTPPLTDVQKQVMATEKAFAKTMADRDFAGFSTFLSDEAVFFSSKSVLHGKAAIAAAWKSLYEKPDAPFSWEPGVVEVLDSGTLALSSGPVRDADGKQISTFTSIWRMDRPGVWHIVFDKGNAVCDCAAK